MFLIFSSNKEPKVIMKTKCCTVMTHVCTKMKQKGIATAEKWLNFLNLIKVVHFSIKLIQLYLIQTRKTTSINLNLTFQNTQNLFSAFWGKILGWVLITFSTLSKNIPVTIKIFRAKIHKKTLWGLYDSLNLQIEQRNMEITSTSLNNSASSCAK